MLFRSLRSKCFPRGAKRQLAWLATLTATGGRPSPAPSDEDSQLRRLKKWLTESPDLLDAPTDKVTPLASAAANGHARVAKFLIDQGVSIDAGPDRHSPLAKAVVGGHLPRPPGGGG